MTASATPPGPPPSVPPPAGGGMPKWLIVLIVIFLVFILGCCGFWSFCRAIAKTATTGFQAATQEIAQGAKQAQQQAGVNFSTNGAAISLPASFPSDVPVYSGFTATQSVAPPGQNSGEVSFTGKGDPQTIINWYNTQMTGKGWTAGPGTTTADAAVQPFTKGDATLSVTVVAAGQNAQMTISYSTK